MSSENKPELQITSEAEPEVLAKIHEECFPTRWNAKEFIDLLSVAGTVAWLAKSPKPCGLIACRNLHEQSEILTLGVLHSQRRKGIATALLEAARAAAVESGAKRMFLEVAQGNAPAVEFYEKAGFRTISSRKAYYRQPDNSYTDALVMACNLP